jgi:hypothetical protein
VGALKTVSQVEVRATFPEGFHSCSSRRQEAQTQFLFVFNCDEPGALAGRISLKAGVGREGTKEQKPTVRGFKVHPARMKINQPSVAAQRLRWVNVFRNPCKRHRISGARSIASRV